MIFDITPDQVRGLNAEEKATFARLLGIYKAHADKNRVKERYYEGGIPLSEVNLGIALPDGMRNLEIGCDWAKKTVDVLAARSMFDGFVDNNGNAADEINRICRENRLIAEYKKTTRDELKLGCTFATLSKDSRIGCKIRFHSAKTATAEWDGDKGRIKSGFAIIDTAPEETVDGLTWKPSLVYLYTDAAVLILRRNQDIWTAERHLHKMGRPLMEPLAYDATSSKPLGRSRIKAPIRKMIQGYVRTVANATIGLEFATAPQKYLLGITDEQFDAVISQKFRQYVGNILAATTNPETGQNPVFGQLPQGTIQPHVEMVRLLATQFSAATGLPVTDTGVVNDANPTSSDAIEAQTKTLVGLAEELNTANGDSLRTIALMALAISRGVTLDEIPEADKDIVAHFKNPALPSISATADAAVKIASVRPAFANTDVYLEMMGFDQADIRRIKNQELRSRGLAIVDDLENQTEPAEGEV